MLDSLVAQRLKSLPAKQETWVLILGQEDLLEKNGNQASILDWEVPWLEEPSRLQPIGSQRVRRLSDFTFIFKNAWKHLETFQIL